MLQNGVWALPRTPKHEQFLTALVADVTQEGGRGLVLTAAPLDPAEHESLVERFRSDRDHEYGEFCEQCRSFLAEVDKETAREKFTFAELEELDEDLRKLSGWLRKIQNRDFFVTGAAGTATAALQQCRDAFERFSGRVYVREGMAPSGD